MLSLLVYFFVMTHELTKTNPSSSFDLERLHFADHVTSVLPLDYCINVTNHLFSDPSRFIKALLNILF
jgi:hypothetical protein